MPDAGYDARDCLEFDLGCVSYVRRYERMLAEVEYVPAPKPRKGERPKIPKPKHSRDEILRVLGLSPREADQARDYVHRPEDWADDLWEDTVSDDATHDWPVEEAD